MPIPPPPLSFNRPLIVGSVSSKNMMARLDPIETESNCDILEIRLDGLAGDHEAPDRSSWQIFHHIPLLFTARRPEEGGLNGHDARARMEMLERALPDASVIDIEAASIPEMLRIVEKATAANIPWIASFHDFKGMPEERDLVSALQHAKDAGAAVFKWAAMLHTTSDLIRLAEFQREDHGIPVASMGMGPLAVVSRLLCAQCGSVLNYGYLGDEPTAPGQWDAGSLRRAITRLPQV